MPIADVLHALAELAPGSRRPTLFDVNDVVWLGTTPLGGTESLGPVPKIAEGTVPTIVDMSAFTGNPDPVIEPLILDGSRWPEGTRLLDDIASRAALNGNSWLELGAIVAVGRVRDATGAVVDVATPVLRTRVELIRTSPTTRRIRRVSDWTWAVDLGGDADLAHRLLTEVPWLSLGADRPTNRRTLRPWLRQIATAQGWTQFSPAWAHPAAVDRPIGEVTFCIGFALRPAAERSVGNTGAALRSWAATPGIDRSALCSLVDGADGSPSGSPSGSPDGSPDGPDGVPIAAPVPLTLAQGRIVAAARRRPITVVSGAPGTGKTHTIAALCSDAVAAGQSVLVATRSMEAADVIATHIGRQPGPNPLRFGSPASLREAEVEIERRMADDPPSSSERLDAVGAGLARASAALDDLLARIAAAQAAGTQLASIGGAEALRRVIPELWSPEVAPPDRRRRLDEIASLIEATRSPAAGWWAKRRHRRALRRIAAATGAPVAALDSNGPNEADGLRGIAAAVAAARAELERAELGTVVEQARVAWEPVIDLVRSHRTEVGLEADRNVIRRLHDRETRAALGAINTALRSGPTARTQLLSSLGAPKLRAAAPLWLGTLGEIERLLPQIAALFDLVVIDEASQVDLALAAPALLRGARAVVIGDPNQLRHVAFTGDAAVEAAFDEHGLAPEIARLHPRRNSVYDVAASAAPVIWLDEHFRSLPHLIRFPLREFYARRVELITNTPATECRDCIDIARCEPGADIATTMRLLRELRTNRFGDVGVITPFRDTADRLTEAVLLEFGPDDIADMRLMVTTAHGFQGAERDHIIVVPGLGPDDTDQRRRFVEQPNLFNVMVTRARRHMVVVTPLEPDTTTRLGRFLGWSEHAPAPIDCPETSGRPGADDLGHLLRDRGIAVRFDYPVGQHAIDLVATGSGRSIAVMCGVHPDGPAAHRRRHIELVQAGWRVFDPVACADAAELIDVAGQIAAITSPSVRSINPA